MTDAKAAIAWDGSESARWRKEVDAWPWKSLGGGDWAKSGQCPRCSHAVSIVEEIGHVAMMIMPKEVKVALMVRAEEGPIEFEVDTGRRFFARCDCGEDHPGRPDGLTRGCGSWGLIDPPSDDD